MAKRRVRRERVGEAASPRAQATQPAEPAARAADPEEAGDAESPSAVVGLCSSAGGLNALTSFFDALALESGMAFVLVPHLDPTHESLMVELVAKHSRLPVCQASDGQAVRANHVYVIPPNRSMTIRGGKLRLTPTRPRGMRTAIDEFLGSLAVDQGRRAIAIILSGTGSHGALGLKEVKLAGGMITAQQPESAGHDSMPRSAIATGLVDYVLRPEEMPSALIEYVRHPYVAGDEAAFEQAPASEGLERVLAVLRERTKFDFRCYRKEMLLRRVQRRMGLCRIESLPAYRQRLRDDADELAALYRDLLIGVTAFFRDAEAFEVLAQRVIAPLVERCDQNTPVRVWVPACATGEEAYSLVMLFLEAFEEARKPVSLQVFATDLDESALAVGRQGEYPESVTASLSTRRLRKFFVCSPVGAQRVNKLVRECIVFAPQSLTQDAPFSRIDLLSCRNLLIYLEREVQTKVIRLFHYALREDGYLLLGPSESVGRQANLFAAVSKKWRIYRRVGPMRHELLEIPIAGSSLARLAPLRGVDRPLESTHGSGTRFSDLTQRTLLSSYAPPSVLVNRRFEILFLQGAAGDFLELPSGRPSTDLLALVRPGLRRRVRSAVLRAATQHEAVIDEDARVKRDGRYVACVIHVRPVGHWKEDSGLLLVSFEGRESRSAPPGEVAPASAQRLSEVEESEVVEQLESELTATREDLQSTLEELEDSNEELQASNEEVLSINEELQSANEELETSREELQSVNEELSTVNSELRGKLQHLEELNSDITDLLTSTEIATLLLDCEMRIKRFTPATAKLLSLRGSDLGRPIVELSARVANEDLIPDALHVLETLTPNEKEVQAEPGHEGRCYLRRILPYRTETGRIEGVVVTYVEITAARRAKDELEQAIAERTARLTESREQIRAIVRTAADAIVAIDGRAHIQLFNPAAESMFGYAAEEVLGRNVKILMPPRYADAHDDHLERHLDSGEARMMVPGREVEGLRKSGELFPLHVTVTRVSSPVSARFVAVLRDLTESKRIREELVREHALSAGIISTARAIILRLDTEGRIVSFNPYMEALSGYKLSEVVGKDWFETFVPERERRLIRRVYSEALRGSPTEGVINSIVTKDGRERRIQWYDGKLQIGEEDYTLLAIGHDVTERERLEQENLRSQKMEAVGRLAGGIAHDFNNLLAGIIAGLHMARDKFAVESATEHAALGILAEVEKEVGRGASMTRRLLDFSRTDTPRPRPIDLWATILSGGDLVRRLIGEDVEVRFECQATRTSVFADPGQVEQALLNLAINARDAMPEGGELNIICEVVTLSSPELEARHLPLSARPYVVLSVQDTGLGMDEATLERCSEAFFTTKAAGLGTGLGLSSVASMIADCGGHLGLESQVGRGTTARLYFPLAELSVPETQLAVQEASSLRARPGERILVLEDEKLVRLGLQFELEELGYQVRLAKDPGEALAILAEEPGSIDLLLSDVVLPGMSGPALADKARALYPDLEVLYMSAFPAEELVRQGRIAPGTVTIAKPFGPNEVASKVRAAID